MPRFDGTGPEAKGSQTGRGLGKCNPKNREQQSENEDQTRQGGRGTGRGKGLGNRRRGRFS